MTFGQYLRDERRRVGVTAEVVSEKIGKSPSLIRMIERGERSAKADVALALARTFDAEARLEGHTLHWGTRTFVFTPRNLGRPTAAPSSRVVEILHWS